MWNCKDSAADMAMFFGRYLKGEENGWEKTSKVRNTALRFSQDPSYDIFEEDFPISCTDYQKKNFST